MVGYHLYVLDKQGHIARCSDFAWTDDAEAVRFAERYPCPYGVELWAGARRIGLFDSHQFGDFPGDASVH
jgi:hypothetical protein